jgi:DNA-binding beta-propeller fold protein YncE
VLDNTTVDLYARPESLSVNPSTNMVYVANEGSGDNTVSVITGKTNKVKCSSRHIASTNYRIHLNFN